MSAQEIVYEHNLDVPCLANVDVDVGLVEHNLRLATSRFGRVWG